MFGVSRVIDINVCMGCIMITTLWGINFAATENIFYFYYLIPLFFLLLYQLHLYRKRSQELVHPTHRSNLLRNYSYHIKLCKIMLLGLGIIALFITLLRPQWDKKEEKISQQGRDLLIAIDISRSMLAQDLKPNRLEFAKEKIKKLLFNLSCERVGLIIFSSSTFMQCPLTTDYAAFLMFLDKLDVDTISSGTTAIDQAIKEGLRVFESNPTQKTKLLVIFTDGEDFSTDLQEVRKKAAENRLSICTVGIGTPHGAPVPIIDKHGKQTGWEKDDQNNVIMSRLNEDLLMNIAQQAGGKYVRGVQSDDDIISLIRMINKFEKDSFEDKSFDAYQEQYPYFIAISFLCFALEWIL